MSLPSNVSNSLGGQAQQFATTRWSIVLAASQAGSEQSTPALESLCKMYWLPVDAYVRRVVTQVEDAQDRTQGFFAHLLETDAIAKADPERGRFRAFLLTPLKNFLANKRHKVRAAKRGGGKKGRVVSGFCFGRIALSDPTAPCVDAGAPLRAAVRADTARSGAGAIENRTGGIGQGAALRDVQSGVDRRYGQCRLRAGGRNTRDDRVSSQADGVPPEQTSRKESP
jgi:DNA-directed RNA polymerase specialized sigma24 family protein